MIRTGRDRLLVGGGVAANRRLRERLDQLATSEAFDLVLAAPELCMDNAAMAAMAWERLARGERAPLDLDVNPNPIRNR